MTWTRIKSFYRYPKTCYSVMTAGTIILAPESVEDAVVSFAFRTGEFISRLLLEAEMDMALGWL